VKLTFRLPKSTPTCYSWTCWTAYSTPQTTHNHRDRDRQDGRKRRGVEGKERRKTLELYR